MAIWLFYVQYCTDFYIYLTISGEIRLEAVKILYFRRRCSTNVQKSEIYHTQHREEEYN
jgi:hypothetical protein